MDERTIEVYSVAARCFADEWRNQPPPNDMYELLQHYFTPGGRTADIGCGAGRDVAWLNDNGFPAVGYDAADGLLAQAAAEYPSLDFERAALPALDTIASNTFDNVLCETVIMHLPPDEVTKACARLLDILKPTGILYLSWRVTEGNSIRDISGRLYSVFDAVRVRDVLSAADILLDVEAVNLSSGKRVHRTIVQRR